MDTQVSYHKLVHFIRRGEQRGVGLQIHLVKHLPTFKVFFFCADGVCVLCRRAAKPISNSIPLLFKVDHLGLQRIVLLCLNNLYKPVTCDTQTKYLFLTKPDFICAFFQVVCYFLYFNMFSFCLKWNDIPNFNYHIGGSKHLYFTPVAVLFLFFFTS